MTARVHQAEDDQLFLVGGSNDVLALYTDAGFSAAVDILGPVIN